MLQALPILISSISLMVSLSVAIYAWKFNELSMRRASREWHAKTLLDIDGVLIDSPELWSIYDDHELAKNKDTSPVAVAKREAYIYQHFNFFEVVRDYYMNIIKRDRLDEEYWHSWDCYIRQFFRSSSEARTVFKAPWTQEIYSESFVEYVNRLINEMSVEKP
jgi:hypothetical protein